MVDVRDAQLFQQSLDSLTGRTHGDTLAVFLAFKHAQARLPHVGEPGPGVGSHVLENLLDDFYEKTHPSLTDGAPRVWQIFSKSSKPRSSYSQNNWRDFFRYALGVGCLADELDLGASFLAEPRSECEHLVRNGANVGCALHPNVTRYIRGVDKPKLLYWANPGPRGTYKLVDLGNPALLETLMPLCSRIRLEDLIRALYFGAAWHSSDDVTFEQFASDFGFDGRGQVEYLFDVGEVYREGEVAAESRRLIDALDQPFELVDDARTALTQVERAVRARGFSRAVREAYDSACAVCGLRVGTPTGRAEVQAAHIYPKRLKGSDDIRNGIALCHNHHWAFDEGLFTIAGDYTLVWHESLRSSPLRVNGKLRVPADEGRRPSEVALSWRRSHFVDILAQSG